MSTASRFLRKVSWLFSFSITRDNAMTRIVIAMLVVCVLCVGVIQGQDFGMFLAVDNTPDFMAIGEKQVDETYFVATEDPQFEAVPVQKPRQHVLPPPVHQEVQKPVQAPMQYVYVKEEHRRGFFRGEGLFKGRGRRAVAAPIRFVGSVIRRGCS